MVIPGLSPVQATDARFVWFAYDLARRDGPVTIRLAETRYRTQKRKKFIEKLPNLQPLK